MTKTEVYFKIKKAPEGLFNLKVKVQETVRLNKFCNIGEIMIRSDLPIRLLSITDKISHIDNNKFKNIFKSYFDESLKDCNITIEYYDKNGLVYV